MLTVSTKISEKFIMDDPVTNIEDLEDGEIESDGEEAVEPQNEKNQDELTQDQNSEVNTDLQQNQPQSTKSGKKKKRNKGDKSKNKEKKSRKLAGKPDEDFAGSVEKAIRKAMNKNDDDEEDYSYDEIDDRRKRKKRKRNEGKDAKKRRKQNFSEDMDEDEMLMVRGASPVHRESPIDDYQDDDRDSFASDGSADEVRNQPQHQRPQRHRQQQRDRKNNMNNKNERNDRRRGVHPMQDPDGVCLYFMQGKCHKGDDCMFSHDAQPPRKMELCKFYLMECCAKRDKCLYLHGDFPCKYYHTGLPCIFKDECKFAHGPPLTDNFKNILLKHIESAPKEILGDFPRLNREAAIKMMQATQMKLIQQYGGDYIEAQETRDIPSLFDVNVGRPPNVPENDSFNNDKHNKFSPKMRQSRWHNDNSNNTNFNSVSSNVLSIKNLTGVLTPRQITDLSKMGIENLDQLSQLTVLQLNSIGISVKQITEIQLNTMNIQKLGLINSEPSPTAFPTLSGTQDLDLRVPPVVTIANASVPPTEFPGQDIDMRFQPVVVSANEEKDNIIKTKSHKDTIDIDQYTKDALKFAAKDSDSLKHEETDESFNVSVQTKDVDHRVLPFSKETPVSINASIKKRNDVDIRFLQPDPIFKSPAKRNRRSTTDDDEDNNLLIDEKWYSSDEDRSSKKKSPVNSPQIMSPPQVPAPHVIESTSVLSRIGDLSKIDISDEVTKLLNTMKNNLPESKVETKSEEIVSNQTRDPRARRSPLNTTSSPKAEPTKSIKKPRVTIYECVDGEPTDGRRRTDVDLREMPTFGDTDLRQGSSGDIDFRLGLPFKPLPNYTPASEIDGSINSHPPMPYKLQKIDIPRPDYTDIRNSTAKSQALVDPRLRKVFRLSTEETNSDNEKPAKSTTTAAAPRVDPRRKPKDNENAVQEQKSLDLQVVIQNSDWYKGLSSTQKIFVNQQIATVTTLVKQFHQDKSAGKQFDLTAIHSNSVFNSIFSNLGICLGENGEFAYSPKPKESLLQTPMNFTQNAGHYGHMNSNMPGGMDPNINMNMMNMPSMGMGGQMNNNMGMGNMPNYNHSYSDPRGGPTPGLLGIAPNIPHNYNGNNFPGPNNYNNMPYNGPGNDYGNMDEQNYPRFPNRGGHRGRSSDRWHRGGGGRGGPRDKKNYNDRGNWKNN